MLANLWHVLGELAPWLLLGAAVAGVMHVLLPRRFVRRQMSGMGGVLKAVALGVPLPLCSCGVIPAALGLRRDGAGKGAAMGFLISTPQTGVDSILVSASFLGLPFALFKVLSAFVMGIVGGVATELAEPSATASSAPDLPDDDKPRTARDGLLHAVDLIRTIWGWVIVGIVVSAAITSFVPENSFAALGLTHPLWAALAVLALSIPLYVCATASVPIAAALVAAGMPAGAALVFLMAGPATNVATIGAVWRSFGARATGIYLATVVLFSISLGLLFDQLLGPDLAAHAGHTHESGPFASVAAVALLAMFVWFASDSVKATWLKLRNRHVAGQTLTVRVEGMSCQKCVGKVERALLATHGVSTCQIELEAGIATVKGQVDETRVRQAIEAAGYVTR